jgi:hypothetical protein
MQIFDSLLGKKPHTGLAIAQLRLLLSGRPKASEGVVGACSIMKKIKCLGESIPRAAGPKIHHKPAKDQLSHEGGPAGE